MPDRTVEFCGEMKADNGKAILVFDGADEFWIPRSQVREMRRIGSRGADYEFTVTEWIAREKGII